MSCGCGCSGEVVAYENWNEHTVDENQNAIAAEYQGRKVTLNKPFRTKGGSKKFGVYTKNEKGNVVLVRFGDPNMEIKRDDPERRKNFRSRHNCDNPGPKWKARYWSCRQWRGGKKVEAGEEPCGCGCECEGYDCGCASDVEAKDADDPCTEGYEQYGMKMKNGRKVPNCIPIKKKAKMEYCASCEDKKACAEHGSCMGDNVKAAEPTPKDGETHDEYMSRCQEMGYSRAECMKAHEGHEFEVEGYYDDEKKKKKADYDSCPPGKEMRDGKCQTVAVTLDLEIDEVEAIVEATTGDTIIEIRGVAFHEGMNKNKWSLTPEGAKLVAERMEGADVTLNHPAASEHGPGFTRNMDGGVEEAVVGYIKSATYFTTANGGYEVRYVAHVVRTELFDGLESGLWSREGYGVSIGGSGVPVSATEDGLTFGEDFTFDHLAIVHKPAYDRATIDSVRRIEKPEMFISHSDSGTDNRKEMVKAMTDEMNDNENFEAEIESLKASLVLAEAKVAEFVAAEDARVEEERMALVEKASDLGMSGHDDLKADTIRSLIASWEEAHPVSEPTVMEPVESETVEETPVAASEAPKAVVANYLNGKMVESDEDIYARCWNAWASAWNGTLSVDEKAKMAAPTYETMKEMI